jgi:uridine kinase
MRVALLISGYLRNYEINIKNLKEKLFSKFEIVDTFLHITKNENQEDKYLNLIDEKEDIQNITKLLNPISTLIEDNVFFHENKQINDIINQWGKLYKLNQLKKIYEKSINKKYDLVIRYRPDVFLESHIENEDLLNLKKIIIPSESKIDKSKLLNPEDDYICDAFAFGNSIEMDKYFDIFQNIEEIISNYGFVSETFLKKYLDNNFIDYELKDIKYSFILSKCNVFAICGDSGSGKSTLSKILKNIFFDSFTLECDRYHKWERHNKNWENLTHLNPDANYLTKMSEDIFDLKLGREIYQVDYNHESGRFTEKQLINPANNLIVCGLHSLYDKNSSFVYDLKIFMDTDEQLKKKWKIKRDKEERGHSVEKILDSIKKREYDFKTYILPQKENADIVVRFFTDEKVDFDNLEKKELIMLDLSISKHFDITNIINNFDLLKINYKLIYQNDSFITIRFFEYQKIDIFNSDKILITNTYYDYILYFILNLIVTK